MMKMDQMYGFSVNLMIGDNSHTPNFILKDEKQKGEKMIEPDVLSLLISGHYSDWFFNVFMTSKPLERSSTQINLSCGSGAPMIYPRL